MKYRVTSIRNLNVTIYCLKKKELNESNQTMNKIDKEIQIHRHCKTLKKSNYLRY